MEKICYKTSRDMKRLKKLLDAGYEVVCFITYDWNRADRDKPGYEPIMATDVCIARLDGRGKYARYIISCRGTEFLDYWLHGFDYNYTFVEMLEARDIQFIEPTTSGGEETKD